MKFLSACHICSLEIQETGNFLITFQKNKFKEQKCSFCGFVGDLHNRVYPTHVFMKKLIDEENKKRLDYVPKEKDLNLSNLFKDDWH